MWQQDGGLAGSEKSCLTVMAFCITSMYRITIGAINMSNAATADLKFMLKTIIRHAEKYL